MEWSTDCISWSQWSCTIYSSCVIFTTHQLYANKHAHGIFIKITAGNKVLFSQNIEKTRNISDYSNITQWSALSEPHVFQLPFSTFPLWHCSWWGSSHTCLIHDLEERQRERRPKFIKAFVPTQGTEPLNFQKFWTTLPSEFSWEFENEDSWLEEVNEKQRKIIERKKR